MNLWAVRSLGYPYEAFPFLPPAMVLTPGVDITRSLQSVYQGYQWPHKKDLSLQKLFFKKRLEFGHTIFYVILVA